MKTRLITFLIVLCTVPASLFAAGQARITGVVVDETGKAVPGVKITVEATEAKTYKDTTTSDRDGKFAIFLLDGTIRYRFTFQKEGHSDWTEVLKLKLLPEKNDVTITLPRAVPVPAAAAPAANEVSGDPSVDLYNTGVQHAMENRDAEAIAKFKEALAANPALSAAHVALMKVHAKMGDWKKSVEAGEKAYAALGDDSDVLAFLAEGYERIGDKAKAAEFAKKAPADPRKLFNEAAQLIMKGDDTKATPLLTQAIALDDDFAQAHYELGMVYARSGKNAEAKKHLQRYIELDPNGQEIATAKEMLKYIQ